MTAGDAGATPRQVRAHLARVADGDDPTCAARGTDADAMLRFEKCRHFIATE